MTSYETAFTRLVGCRLPIQSAPMVSAVADAELPAAVADAGGHGMFPAGFLTAPYVEHVIDDLAARTCAFGINIIVPFLDEEVLEIAAHRTPLVELLMGEPNAAIVERIHAGGALAAWNTSGVEAAQAAEAAGCDMVVIQSMEAGGHPSTEIGLLPLLDAVLDRVAVPVVAGGGIGSSRGVAAVIAAGAAAARIGTRFVCAGESTAHPAHQQAIIAASPQDAVVTTRFSAGDPIETTQRVVQSAIDAADALPDGAEAGEVVIGGMRIPVQRFSSWSPTAASTGAVDAMALYAGQSVGAVHEVQSAAEIVADLAARLPVLRGEPAPA